MVAAPFQRSWNTYIRSPFSDKPTTATSGEYGRVNTEDAPFSDAVETRAVLPPEVVGGGVRHFRKWLWRAFFLSLPSDWRIIAYKEGNDAVITRPLTGAYTHPIPSNAFETVHTFAVEFVMRDVADDTIPDVYCMCVFATELALANKEAVRVHFSETTFDLGSSTDDLTRSADTDYTIDALTTTLIGAKTDYSIDKSHGGGWFMYGSVDTVDVWDMVVYVATSGQTGLYFVVCCHGSFQGEVNVPRTFLYFGQEQGAAPNSPYYKNWVATHHGEGTLVSKSPVRTNRVGMQASKLFHNIALTQTARQMLSGTECMALVIGPGGDSDPQKGNPSFPTFNKWRTCLPSYGKEIFFHGWGGAETYVNNQTAHQNMGGPLGLGQVTGLGFSPAFTGNTATSAVYTGIEFYAEARSELTAVLGCRVAVQASTGGSNPAYHASTQSNSIHPEDATRDYTFESDRQYVVCVLPDMVYISLGSVTMDAPGAFEEQVSWNGGYRWTSSTGAPSTARQSCQNWYQMCNSVVASTDLLWLNFGSFALPWNRLSTFDQGGPVTVLDAPSDTMRGSRSIGAGALDVSAVDIKVLEPPAVQSFYLNGVVVTFTTLVLDNINSICDIDVHGTLPALDRGVTITVVSIDGFGGVEIASPIVAWDGVSFLERFAANSVRNLAYMTDSDQFLLDPSGGAGWPTQFVRITVTTDDGGLETFKDYEVVSVPSQGVREHTDLVWARQSPTDPTEVLGSAEAVVYKAAVDSGAAAMLMGGVSCKGGPHRLLFRSGIFATGYRLHSRFTRTSTDLYLYVRPDDGWRLGTRTLDLDFLLLGFIPGIGAATTKTYVGEFSSTTSGQIATFDPVNATVTVKTGAVVDAFMVGVEEPDGTTYVAAHKVTAGSAVSLTTPFQAASVVVVGASDVSIDLKPVGGWFSSDVDVSSGVQLHVIGFRSGA